MENVLGTKTNFSEITSAVFLDLWKINVNNVFLISGSSQCKRVNYYNVQVCKCFKYVEVALTNNTMSSKEDKVKDSHPPPSHEVKWKNSQQYDVSNYPPKLKSPVSMCHIYLLYSVTMVCLVFSTYSFSQIYSLQQEVCNSSSCDIIDSNRKR